MRFGAHAGDGLLVPKQAVGYRMSDSEDALFESYTDRRIFN